MGCTLTTSGIGTARLQRAGELGRAGLGRSSPSFEHTDDLHEAFEAPAAITKDGFPLSPAIPGYSCDVRESEFEKLEASAERAR